jgi:hypothetical protein
MRELRFRRGLSADLRVESRRIANVLAYTMHGIVHNGNEYDILEIVGSHRVKQYDSKLRAITASTKRVNYITATAALLAGLQYACS